MPGAGAHNQGRLAIIARAGDTEMAELFACLDQRQDSVKRILYFGIDPQNYLDQGLVTHYPLIQIIPRFFSAPDIQNVLQLMPIFTHCIFTSQNSVELFFEHLLAAGIAYTQMQSKHVLP